MSTGIEWADEVWNCIRGCSRVSEGCRHCYAERTAARFSGPGQPYEGLVKVAARRQIEVDAAGEPTGRARDVKEARWNGEVRFVVEHLADPLRWKKPRRIFVNSMSDLFHEKLTNEQIAAVFGVMAAAPRHTFIVLTKRARRMREWFEWLASSVDPFPAGALDLLDEEATSHLGGVCHLNLMAKCKWPLPNVILGVSVENQAAADERIPDLLATPAAVRAISAEPLLGPLDLSAPCPPNARPFLRSPDRISWVIAGCESGPGARVCSTEWLRSLRDQCAEAGVAYFLKQATRGTRDVRAGVRRAHPAEDRQRRDGDLLVRVHHRGWRNWLSDGDCVQRRLYAQARHHRPAVPRWEAVGAVPGGEVVSAWEHVTPDGLARIAVPGGWLYRYHLGTELTFVPEPRRELLDRCAAGNLERAIGHLPELVLRLLKRIP